MDEFDAVFRIILAHRLRGRFAEPKFSAALRVAEGSSGVSRPHIYKISGDDRDLDERCLEILAGRDQRSIETSEERLARAQAEFRWNEEYRQQAEARKKKEAEVRHQENRLRDAERWKKREEERRRSAEKWLTYYAKQHEEKQKKDAESLRRRLQEKRQIIDRDFYIAEARILDGRKWRDVGDQVGMSEVYIRTRFRNFVMRHRRKLVRLHWSISPTWRTDGLEFVEHIERGSTSKIISQGLKTGNDLMMLWEITGFNVLKDGNHDTSPMVYIVLRDYLSACMAYDLEILGYVEDAF